MNWNPDTIEAGQLASAKAVLTQAYQDIDAINSSAKLIVDKVNTKIIPLNHFILVASN